MNSIHFSIRMIHFLLIFFRLTFNRSTYFSYFVHVGLASVETQSFSHFQWNVPSPILQSQWKVYVYNLFIEFPISCNVHGTHGIIYSSFHLSVNIPACPKTAATENWYRIPIPCTRGPASTNITACFLSPWTHNSGIESW